MNSSLTGIENSSRKIEGPRFDLQCVRQQLDELLVSQVVAEENVVAEGSRARDLGRRDTQMIDFAPESSTISSILSGATRPLLHPRPVGSRGPDMADDKIKNVFVSHVHEDDEGLGKLNDLLKKKGMIIRDGSISSGKPNEAESPDYIKSEILAPRINWAGTFITYITPKTKDSEWVDWEIEYAEKQGKRIVGIWAHGHNECEAPEALKKYADTVVPWNTDKIIAAIEGKSSDWEDPDGKPVPERLIARANC
jgi:MTH538 TIR-like domain (DUF1863)